MLGCLAPMSVQVEYLKNKNTYLVPSMNAYATHNLMYYIALLDEIGNCSLT